MNKTIKLLEKLSNGHGPTGYEGQIRQIIREEITNPENSIDTDGLGSLISKIEKEITEKSKTGPELALVEGVIPSSIISNVTYSGFIVKYETN